MRFSMLSFVLMAGLTRAQRVTVQRQLTTLGYPTGGADGLWGANTRAAITR